MYANFIKFIVEFSIFCVIFNFLNKIRIILLKN